MRQKQSWSAFGLSLHPPRHWSTSSSIAADLYCCTLTRMEMKDYDLRQKWCFLMIRNGNLTLRIHILQHVFDLTCICPHQQPVRQILLLVWGQGHGWKVRFEHLESPADFSLAIIREGSVVIVYCRLFWKPFWQLWKQWLSCSKQFRKDIVGVKALHNLPLLRLCNVELVSPDSVWSGVRV